MVELWSGLFFSSSIRSVWDNFQSSACWDGFVDYEFEAFEIWIMQLPALLHLLMWWFPVYGNLWAFWGYLPICTSQISEYICSNKKNKQTRLLERKPVCWRQRWSLWLTLSSDTGRWSGRPCLQCILQICRLCWWTVGITSKYLLPWGTDTTINGIIIIRWKY